jgi:hypothetical protein
MKTLGIGFVALWIAAIVGWIMNIVALYGASFDPLTGPVILRIVGIFVAPLGSILGLFF